MNQGRIIVITGSPGTGKTTIASIVAKESNMDKSVHAVVLPLYSNNDKSHLCAYAQIYPCSILLRQSTQLLSFLFPANL